MSVYKISDEHREALEHFNAQRDLMTANGSVPPCAGDDRFISEDSGELHEAAQQCAFCPIRSACEALGEHEAYGVWGGNRRNGCAVHSPNYVEMGIYRKYGKYSVRRRNKHVGTFETLREAREAWAAA